MSKRDDRRDDWVEGMMAEGRPEFRQQTLEERIKVKLPPLKLAIPLTLLFMVYGGWMGIANWEISRLFAYFCFAMVGLLGIGLYKIIEAHGEFAAMKELDYQQALAHHRATQATSLEQRPNLVATFTNVDIEKLRAQGVLDATQLQYARDERNIQLTHEENQRVREHEAEQNFFARTHQAMESKADRKARSKDAARDRSLSWQQLLEKHRHDLEVMEKRVRSSVDITADELAAYELEKAAMSAIENEPDTDKKERMIRRLDKRLYR